MELSAIAAAFRLAAHSQIATTAAVIDSLGYFQSANCQQEALAPPTQQQLRSTYAASKTLPEILQINAQMDPNSSRAKELHVS